MPLSAIHTLVGMKKLPWWQVIGGLFCKLTQRIDQSRKWTWIFRAWGGPRPGLEGHLQTPWRCDLSSTPRAGHTHPLAARLLEAAGSGEVSFQKGLHLLALGLAPHRECRTAAPPCMAVLGEPRALVSSHTHRGPRPPLPSCTHSPLTARWAS